MYELNLVLNPYISSCVIQGKLLKLSSLNFLIYKLKVIIVSFSQRTDGGLNEIVLSKLQAQCLACGMSTLNAS